MPCQLGSWSGLVGVLELDGDIPKPGSLNLAAQTSRSSSLMPPLAAPVSPFPAAELLAFDIALLPAVVDPVRGRGTRADERRVAAPVELPVAAFGE